MKNNKIGLLTVTASDNVGSLLQAFALQYYLQNELKLNTEFINLYNFWARAVYSIWQFIPYDWRKNPIKFLKYLVSIARRLQNYSLFKKQKLAYQMFKDKHLSMSEDRYYNLKNLYNATLDYSVYLTGSDQIWNVRMCDRDDAYFLPFVKNVKKIAYAPSCAGTPLSLHKYPNNIKRYILDYDYVSVRENSGKNYIKDLTGLDVPIVVDPTLLVNPNIFYNLAGERKINEPYIFFYHYSYNDTNHNNIIKNIASQLGLKVYVINYSKWSNLSKKEFTNLGFHLCEEAGPLAFLNLMKFANYSFIQSLHGIIFSYIFKRDFYVLDEHTDNTLEERIEDLLTMLDCKDRVIRKMRDFDMNASSIDYQRERPILSARHKLSVEFLNEAFKDL